MRLLMAMSYDGFLCRDSQDDMKWTGHTDKQVFRLLTLSDSGPLLAGRVTAEALPKLPGRTVWSISRQGLNLEAAYHSHPNAWLIGGPNVAIEALRRGFIDRAYICRSQATLGGGVSVQDLARYLPTDPAHTIKILGVDVLVFTDEQLWPAR